jgi:hypothetical protein
MKAQSGLERGADGFGSEAWQQALAIDIHARRN